jgi:ABC-type lipoprotein release transport system permease subunit
MHDIGILRSLGASKTFVGMLFNVQNGFIGLLSRVIGLIGGALLMKPIVGVIVEVMERNDITTFDISSLRLLQFWDWISPSAYRFKYCSVYDCWIGPGPDGIPH